MNVRKILITAGAPVVLALALIVARAIPDGADATDAGLVVAHAAAPAPGGLLAAHPPRPRAGMVQPAAVADVGADDHVLGDPDAPLTIIEYASLTCPHCATFHRETLPKLKKNWIEPGELRLVYRHYPLDQLALRAALLANCFEGDKFFAVTDLLFKSQQRWSRAENPMQQLARLASMAGLSQSRFEACMTDRAEADRIIEKQIEARNEIDLSSTPTFLVAGEKIVGAKPYEVFVKKLEDAGS